MIHDDDSLLIAEYALGLLNDVESAAFKKRLANESDLRAAYLAWTENLASLYLSIEEVTPPPALKASIQSRLFNETTSDVKHAESKAKPKSPWFWPANLISGLVLATLIGFIYQASQRDQFQPDYVARLETKDKSFEVNASYDEKHNLLKVSTIKATPAEGRSHELWLIAGDSPPVSLGTLRSIDDESIVLPDNLSEVIVGSTLAISDEPAGGSPEDGPTGEVLITAMVTKI